jgi:allantoate deiminase
MSLCKINATRLRKSIHELSEIGRQSTGGISRFTFTPADIKARQYVSNLMRESGLSIHVDRFGNIVGHMSGAFEGAPAVMCGSHIDTVPNGGPLDGAYGVLSGIEVARTILEQRIRIKNPFEVVVFTEEEGARFPSFIGSLGFTGMIRPEDAYIMKDRNGITFKRALTDAGLNHLTSLHTYARKSRIKAYIELHIEQGPVLERERVPIGVVEAIVGLGDLKVALEGTPGHAGTTPMRGRHDALLGASRIITGVNKVASRRRDAVATVGSLVVSPNASNVVPERVTLTIDFRHPTIHGLGELRGALIDLTKRVGKEEGLKVRIERSSFIKPARMTARIVKAITEAVQSLGLGEKRMVSGAGHDCQNMARITEAGMIFVPSLGGASHVPGEWTSNRHLEAGANALLNTLLRLLSVHEPRHKPD